MSLNLRTVLPVVLVTMCFIQAQAGERKPSCESRCKVTAFPNPEDGDTVVFVGDSITWQDYYAEYIDAYFFRRHPDRRISFLGLGVRGDTAAGVIERLDRDLYLLNPDLVFVMLGMNDGGYRGYNKLLLEYYLYGMEQIVDLVKKNTKARVVLVSSTCVDPVNYNTKRYNGMLQKMASGLEDLARKLDLPFVNLFVPFKAVLERAKASSIRVRLMQDTVHPSEAGHLIMASMLLDRMEPRDMRKSMKHRLHASKLQWKDGRACILYTHPGDNVYIPKRLQAALALVGGKRFSSRRLVVAGLKHRVRIFVDDKIVGVFSPGELAVGVDVDSWDDAPWVRDARLLYVLLRERWRLSYYLWDPQELGKDAWRQVSPHGRAMTKEQAYDRLLKISTRIESIRVHEPRSYTLCIQRLK